MSTPTPGYIGLADDRRLPDWPGPLIAVDSLAIDAEETEEVLANYLYAGRAWFYAQELTNSGFITVWIVGEDASGTRYLVDRWKPSVASQTGGHELLIPPLKISAVINNLESFPALHKSVTVSLFPLYVPEGG